MITLTIDQLDRILDHIASQMATLERIQSVSTIPRGTNKKQFKKGKKHDHNHNQV